MRTDHQDKALSASVDLGPVSRTAQALQAALAGYQEGKPCPNCGAVAKHCRPVPAGYFCQRDSLLADAGADIAPSPDPQAELVKRDGPRKLAEVLRAAAACDFETADRMWCEACQALRDAQRAIASDKGSFSDAQGWRPSPDTAALAKLLPSLEAKTEDAFRAREIADAALGEANAAFTRAHDDALHRAGLPRVAGNTRAGSAFGRSVAGYFGAGA